MNSTNENLQQTIIYKFVWVESNWSSPFKALLVSFLLYRYRLTSEISTKGYDYVIKNHINNNAVDFKIRESVGEIENSVNFNKDLAKNINRYYFINVCSNTV